ncbi:hypothetical protein MP228_007665 [Amoeboaphelidium protococcarum]|nr:hypothetical protein MP228_007665 [Amoeboaphelidium protococcarum]
MVNANFIMCYAISVGIWRSFASGISIVMRNLNLFIKGHMFGFALEGSNEVVVKTIPKISKPADQTKAVSINNLHSKECVGPRNIPMGEHWIKKLPCIFRKQKTIVSQGQVAVFDADCFGAYRKSQSGVYPPTTRCYSCDNAAKKSAGKNGQLQRDLHKLRKILCEVVGCSSKSAMGMLIYEEFIYCAAQNKNRLYAAKVERYSNNKQTGNSSFTAGKPWCFQKAVERSWNRSKT